MERAFRAGAGAVRQARQLVTDALVKLDVPAWPGNLLVTELVTNVVVHVRRAFTVRVVVGDTSDDGVRVEVEDDDPELPVCSPSTPHAPGGRGLAMVEALATEWGTSPSRSGKGKIVWFTLSGDRAGARGIR